MAAKEFRKSIYLQDNLAPKIDVLPEEEQIIGFKPQVIEGRNKVAIHVKKGYTILLFSVILLFIAVCSIYLKSAFSLVALQKEANLLKSEWQLMKMQNAQLEAKIHETVDLEKIYEIAIHKLQMRLPKKEEIHYITRKSESYTIKLNSKNRKMKRNSLVQFAEFIMKDW